MASKFRRNMLRNALIAALMVSAAMTNVYAQEQVKTFDIAAQPAATGLNAFAEQADITLVFSQDVVAGIEIKPLKGDYSIIDGLARMLEGTRLSYQQVSENTVAINSESSSASVSSSQLPRSPSEQESPVELDPIVVTGTRIRGISDGPSPVIVYDAAAIESSGAGTLSQFMRTLPSNFSGGIGEELTSGLAIDAANISKGTTINLRGLGSAGTLILLNGRRLPSSNNGDFVDISSIPVGAIDRLEVLTDGASAIYGSDAIGGVVNIVLRTDYDGVETSVRAASVTDGGFEQYGVTQTFGHDWASGRFLAVYDYFDQNALNAADRDYTRTATVETLAPAQTKHSLLLSGEQQIAERAWLSSDVLYSTRDVDTRSVAGGPGSVLENEVWSAAAGLRVAMTDEWELDVNGSFGLNDLGRQVFPSEQKSSYKNVTQSVEVKADGVLFSMPGGQARAAFGGSYFRQEFDTTQTNPLNNRDLRRDVSAAFVEINLPVIGSANASNLAKRLEFSLATRTEHYSDFGNTTNSKFGLLWAPTNELVLRTTWGTSFRAPDFFENSLLDSVQLRSNFPDPGTPTGLSTVLILNGSNNPLFPETADVFTAGIEYRGDHGFRSSLNYFDIDYKDRISGPGIAAAMLANPDLYASFIARNPTPDEFLQLITNTSFFDNRTGVTPPPLADVVVDSRLTNLGSQQVSGLDLSFSYTKKLGVGSFSTGLESTYLIERDDQIIPGGPVSTQLNNVYGPVDLAARLHATISFDEFESTLFINYRDGYENRFVMPVQPVDSWTTVDLTFIYRPRWLPETTAILSIQNLADEDPPFVNSPSFDNVNYDAANASALGRLISLQIKHRW